MKLCVKARQDIKYLEWAEEIIVEYRDIEVIPDILEKYPEKRIIVYALMPPTDVDWTKLQNYNLMAKDNFVIGVNNGATAEACMENDLKFYFTYPITSYDELRAAIGMGVEYARLGAPLFFDMNNIHTAFPDLKIRLVPNVAYNDFYLREDGVCGTWVRPEDLMMYDDYVYILDFQTADPAKERALIRIYWEQREWPGDLDMLIEDLDYSGVNRMLMSDLTEARLNCRQKCKAGYPCHICYRSLDLADPELIQEYADSVKTKYEAPKDDEEEEEFEEIEELEEESEN